MLQAATRSLFIHVRASCSGQKRTGRAEIGIYQRHTSRLDKMALRVELRDGKLSSPSFVTQFTENLTAIARKEPNERQIRMGAGLRLMHDMPCPTEHLHQSYLLYPAHLSRS